MLAADSSTTEMISKGSGRKRQKVEVWGCMGQAKGKKQVLWEWGLWKEGMILTIDDTDERGRSQDLSMDHTLQVSSSLCGRVCWLTSSWQACTCFATEETALQHLVQSRGHILMMSVKGHPEMAGCGIEYCWGKSKHDYRQNNDCVARHLHRNIKNSLSTEGEGAVLPLARVRKFARKARTYRRIYAGLAVNDPESHAFVERMYKVSKTHRSALDLDFKFIMRT